jgi:Holliday junction DNA helicase RuvA
LEKTAGRAVVEVGGLGLSLQTPLTTFLALPAPPSEVTLLARLIVREESWDLYGFLTRLERESFDVLTSVTRVGPKLALTVISALAPEELGRVLLDQDLGRLSAIKGIGLKTAERLLVELKDKAHRLVALSGSSGGPGQSGGQGAISSRDEAALALANLGYTRAESEKAVRSALAALGADAQLPDVLREALKILSL